MNLNSKEVKSFYNPIKYDMKKIKQIVKQLYPNSHEEIELLEKMIKDLENKINELKKD